MKLFDWMKKILGEQNFNLFVLNIVFYTIYISLVVVMSIHLNNYGDKENHLIPTIMGCMVFSFIVIAPVYLIARRIFIGKMKVLDSSIRILVGFIIFFGVCFLLSYIFYCFDYFTSITEYFIANIRSIIPYIRISIFVLLVLIVTRMIYRFVFLKSDNK